MLIDAYATLPNYRDHLAPIWRELVRLGVAGDFFTPRPELGYREITARDQARQDRPMLVAGYTDAMKWPGRMVVYVEHGAGQHYPASREAAESGSYSGGSGLGNVALFIGPNQAVADRWLARYPAADAVAVGCPRLDRWHQQIGMGHDPRPTTICVAWHFDLGICQETRWALPHYQPQFGELRDYVAGQGWRLIGHGHPRATRALAEFYAHHRVPYVSDVGTVFDQADLLVMDNSSLIPEFASLGKPVVFLNAPWYESTHGGRFWDWPKGQVMVNDMDELIARLPEALADPPEAQAARRRMVEAVYAWTDGRAAERAAAAIVALL